MPSYLLQVSYTPQAWAAMVAKPQDRSAKVKAAIEELGGKITGFWLTLGDYDIISIIEMPNAVSAAAFAMAVSAGGACKAVKTTALLTPAEGMKAMKKAATCGYKPAR